MALLLDLSTLPALSLSLLRLFLALISLVSLYNVRRLFLEPIGRSHRLTGLAHLSCIIFGALAVVCPPNQQLNNDDNANTDDVWHAWSYQCLIYDICLGMLGTAATLTAAKDFPHKTITNDPGQSGTLSKEATVTQSEMIEHSFYQMLNLIQAIYLHEITWLWDTPSVHAEKQLGTITKWTEQHYLTVSSIRPIILRLVAIFAATSPWLLRKYFPVNSFSENWTKKAAQGGKRPETATEWLETRLYQIKKWQYVFYKHCILHGLNVSVAFPASNVTASSISASSITPLTLSKSWRIFWLCLNASYVMEFFLQSLVKRRFVSQRSMLGLQRILMTAASISAMLAVWGIVRPELCLISVLLNFTNRGRDVSNVMLVAVLAGISSMYVEQEGLTQHIVRQIYFTCTTCLT